MTITSEQFVTAWQSSKSLDEVVRKTGATKKYIQSRAFRLRKKGVPLKRLLSEVTRPVNNWVALAELAKQLGEVKE